MALTVPRHTGEMKYIMTAMETYFNHGTWLDNETFIEKQSLALIQKGIDTERNSDRTHYTKDAEIVRYFGFAERKTPGDIRSEVRLTPSGINFYTAWKENNLEECQEEIMKALETITFGRNNEGCGSNSCVEAPKVCVQASLILAGINKKELAYILDALDRGQQFSFVLLSIMRCRELGKSLPSYSVTEDQKYVQFMRNVGFFEETTGTVMIRIPQSLKAKYYSRIQNLQILNSSSISAQNISNSSLIPIVKEFNEVSNIYYHALRTKPFMLLAGISGTGKSRIVRKLAQACWPLNSEQRKAQVPANFCMVQVKPNWHDSSELIGYVSRTSGKSEFVVGDFLKFVAKAWENWLSEDKKPYFLCLDEMNLAPVEQYFAEYLSVLESRKYNAETGEITSDPIIKKDTEDWFRIFTANLTLNDTLREQFLVDGICLPPNLIVVGTVNMDETTFSFSRKVLDRAMVIEMNEVNLNGGLRKGADEWDNVELSASDVLPQFVEGKDFYERNEGTCNSIIEKLGLINDVLDGTPFKIAYRTRNEVLLYILNRMSKECSLEQALDEVVNMKILSRIEGDKNKVVDKEGNALLPKLIEVIKEVCGDNEKSPSLLKLEEMKKKLDKQFYCSYWN